MQGQFSGTINLISPGMTADAPFTLRFSDRISNI